MSFKNGLISAFVVLSGVSAGWTGQALAETSPAESDKSRHATKETRQAQVKNRTPTPTPAVDQGLSNIDRVNKALNPGPSNPDVPLPHPGLANSSTNGRQETRSGAQIFGRQEEGGGVLGLRMPIPADRSAPGVGTKSSSP